jgi:hypothetical protein
LFPPRCPPTATCAYFAPAGTVTPPELPVAIKNEADIYGDLVVVVVVGASVVVVVVGGSVVVVVVGGSVVVVVVGGSVVVVVVGAPIIVGVTVSLNAYDPIYVP